MRPACWDKTHREADRPKVEANWPLMESGKPSVDVENGWPHVVALWFLRINKLPPLSILVFHAFSL